MRTKDLFKDRTVISFEVFPPKKTSSIDTIYNTLDELNDLSPDFISVTYGAGGNGGNQTLQIVTDIKDKYNKEAVAHLPCINFSKEEVISLLDDFKENSIENILALRGDKSPDITPKSDFKYASDLISFIKSHGDFNIIGACYPEGHSECTSVVDDIAHLKEKVNAGADSLISQLFFDNEYFYSFLERTKIAGINVPIEAGIMPVTNKKQIERMVSLCGVHLPKKFMRVMNKYENNPEALRDAGIAYATDQIVDLIASGVDGIHLYTMNNPYIAKKICHSISSIINV